MPESDPTPKMPVVIVKDGHAVADSRDVAAAFGKQHKDVLRKIDSLLAGAPDLERNFAPMIAEVEVGKGAIRHDRAFEMDRKGFSLLAMRFTGAKALQWQLAYIDAFDRMEAALHSSSNALELTGEVRGVIGGIVKSVMHKEIATLLPVLVFDELLAIGINCVSIARVVGSIPGHDRRDAGYTDL